MRERTDNAASRAALRDLGIRGDARRRLRNRPGANAAGPNDGITVGQSTAAGAGAARRAGAWSSQAHALIPAARVGLCRVCRNDVLRKKVNDLLGTGASYAMIVRALAADNAELDKCDRVTIDSVSNHCGRHFPVQHVAKATYREILERRAKANGVDFVEGVATAITPIAFFETVMVRSYETFVDSDTRVDVNTGIVAAGRLQSLMDSRDYSHDVLE